MSALASASALAASGCWATAAILVAKPSKELGSFHITRIQLVSATPFLALLVTWTDGWQSISLSHWLPLLGSAFLGVFLGNLALMACLRRGGPRRMQLLMALNPVFVLILSSVYLGETVSLLEGIGCLVTMIGIMTAIFFRTQQVRVSQFERTEGSVISMLGFGIAAALCQATGLIILKPVMADGVAPLATSFLRTGIAAALILVLGLLPIRGFRLETAVSLPLFGQAALPGLLGYVCAVSLLLIGLHHGNAGIVSVLGATAPVLMLPMLWLLGTRNIPWSAWLGAGVATAGTAILIAG